MLAPPQIAHVPASESQLQRVAVHLEVLCPAAEQCQFF
jgi:hypothetical protein